MMRPAGENGHTHDEGLWAIGIFKLLKAATFLSIGFGALHFLHHDLSEAVQHIVATRGFDPENHFVSLVMDKSELVTHHRLQQIGLGTLAYGVLATCEGVGLMLRKVWAEYLTLWLSISFLPWEIFELVRHADWIRVVIFLSNAVIVAYIVWVLERKKSQRATESSSN